MFYVPGLRISCRQRLPCYQACVYLFLYSFFGLAQTDRQFCAIAKPLAYTYRGRISQASPCRLFYCALLVTFLCQMSSFIRNRFLLRWFLFCGVFAFGTDCNIVSCQLFQCPSWRGVLRFFKSQEEKKSLSHQTKFVLLILCRLGCYHFW